MPNSDLLISISLTLFMLSLITEKISNFLKMHFTSLFQKNEEDEVAMKQREKRIQLLSAIIGIIVALLCNADFFNLIKSDGSVLAPLSISGLTFKSVLGCFITGLFLSQGSKFFHDLLDTLLFYKNTKRNLYNKQEIENTLLASGKNYNADEFIKTVTADQREDEPDNNL